MITPEQEKWLSHLLDDNSVEIFPYDEASVEKFELIKKQIQDRLGEEVSVVHKGATSLGISGQGELDVYLPVAPSSFGIFVGHLTEMFGKPRSHYLAQRAAFVTSINDTKVEVFVINQDSDDWRRSETFEKYLKNNQDALKAYETLKENNAGKSTQAYYRSKIEFINEILEKEP